MPYELYAVPKPSSKKQKTKQSQRGDIGDQVDIALKERSQGICELCEEAEAVDRAHLTGRPHLNHDTAVTDLMHLCRTCHRWLDHTPDGIRARRFIARAINTVLKAQE